MERLSILHTFESDSTFLAEAPCVTPRSSTRVVMGGRHSLNEGCGDRFEGENEGLTNIDSSLDNLPSRSDVVEEERGLCIVRIVPISGTVAFHSRFLIHFEAYCRLSRRLRRAIEWLLLDHQAERGHIGGSIDCLNNSMFDVDCLTRATYPVDPTAFLASAFALPLVVSVSPTPLEEDDMQGSYGDTSDRTRVIPYCFFHASPERRVLRGRVIPSSPTERSGMTIVERFAAVAKATGICGIVPPSHSSLSIKNRTKVGLTLLAYMEGCLPNSILVNGEAGCRYGLGGSGGTGGGAMIDLFSQWTDDILWRLLCSLVSALTVVHAGGFHYCGELSPADILCFAVPGDSDPGVAAAEAVMSGDHEECSDLPAGQRFLLWAAASERQWAITGTTPAHRAFFMFTTPPRSLFANLPDDSHTTAEAQRLDIVAAGRIVLKVVEEMKRRRGRSEVGGCVELLFVAQRMVSLEESGGNVSRNDVAALAQRFSQLQVIRLRTHLCLLRTVVEERNAQLVAAILYSRNQVGASGGEGDSKCQDKGDNYSFLEKEKLARRPTCSPEASYMPDSGSSTPVVRSMKSKTLAERERALAEREEKFNQFLAVYELTAEQVDQLPAGSEGFEFLQKMLMRVAKGKIERPRTKLSSGARSSGKDIPKEATVVSSVTKLRCPTPRAVREVVRKATPSAERRQLGFSNFCGSKARDSAPLTATGGSSSAGPLPSSPKPGLSGVSKDKRLARTLYKQTVPSAHSSSSVRCGSTKPNVTSAVQRAVVRAPASSRNGVNSPNRRDSVERTGNSRLKDCFLNIPFARTANRIEAAERLKTTPRAPPTPVNRGTGRLLSNKSPTRIGITAVSVRRESMDREPLRSSHAVRPERQLQDGDTLPPNVISGQSLRLSARVAAPQEARTPPPKSTAIKMSLESSVSQREVPRLQLPDDSTALIPDKNLYSGPVAGALTDPEIATQPKQADPVNTKAQARVPTDLEIVKSSRQSDVADSPRLILDLSSQVAATVDDSRGIMTIIDMCDDNQAFPGDKSVTLNSTAQCASAIPAPAVTGAVLGHLSIASECNVPAAEQSVSTVASEATRGYSERRTVLSSQQQSSGRNGNRGERDSSGTPRSVRPRVCDGWVDNHLAALERMRTDFHSSEATKSTKCTPNDKGLVGITVTHLGDHLDSILCSNTSTRNSADRSVVANSEN